MFMGKKNPNIYQRALDIVNNRINPDISQGGSVQSDWNQNDSTAVDYVKNRPFYTGDPVETVLVEESTIVFSEQSESLYLAQFSSEFVATVGETYTVHWDNIAYECVCVNVEGMPCLGNLSIMGVSNASSEPFLIAMRGGTMAIYTSDTSASHTISISKLVEEVVKIDTKYLPFVSKPGGNSYLTFSSQNSFSLGVSEKTWDGTLEYFASDNTWTVWDGTDSLSAATNGAEYVLYLRGTGNTVITNAAYWKLSGSNIACIGNIETLLDYATVERSEHPTMAAQCYTNMFGAFSSLTQAPELPATVLSPDCYAGMFDGCTSLTQAPKLPATTLATGCYLNMFYGCTSLTQVPKLPATTLANACYQSMFYGCTSLTQAPELPATTLATDCYANMFYGCTSLIQAPELPATALTDRCYLNMFRGCSNLKLSENKTGEYTQEYRIPFSGDGIASSHVFDFDNMFDSTGGTFTGTPEINTTYYLSSDNMIARGTEIATLNGYVKNMIDNAECIIPSSTSGSTKKFKITVDDQGAITATEVT